MAISLAAPSVQAFQLGGSTIETADSAALIFWQVDMGSNFLTLLYKLGTPASAAFAASGRASFVQVSVALNGSNPGAWSASNGTSGVLTAPQLASAQTMIKQFRNTAEVAAINIFNLFPSASQVAW